MFVRPHFLPSLANDFLRRAASKAVLTLISAVENPLGLSSDLQVKIQGHIRHRSTRKKQNKSE